MAIGIESQSIKHTLNLTVLRKNNRKRSEKTAGRKRPRVNDVEVIGAGDGDEQSLANIRSHITSGPVSLSLEPTDKRLKRSNKVSGRKRPEHNEQHVVTEDVNVEVHHVILDEAPISVIQTASDADSVLHQGASEQLNDEEVGFMEFPGMSRPAFGPLRNVIPVRIRQLINDDIGDACLVNSHANQIAIEMRFPNMFTDFIIMEYSDEPYNVGVLSNFGAAIRDEIDVNVFNCLVDYAELHEALNKFRF